MNRLTVCERHCLSFAGEQTERHSMMSKPRCRADFGNINEEPLPPILALHGGLLELVRKLDALGPSPSLTDLAHTMKASQLTTADVAPFVRTNPQSDNRAPVVVRKHYELLVMTWLPGQASIPHDHDGSICVLQVVQGEAAEGCYRIATDGFVDLEYEETVRTGEVTAFGDAGVHTVRSASQIGETLVTVHAYAPPLRDFRRFVPRPSEPAGKRRPTSDDAPTVVIVGGGFSGSKTAAQILRRADAPLRVVLVERRGAVGEGVAYATREPMHLLNVPAGRMSAWPDRPDDFVEWARRRHGNVHPSDFLPRQWYGEYVRDTLLASAADIGGSANLSVVFDEVRRVARHPAGGWMLHLEGGPSVRADAVVLAIGHCPPADPIGGKWTGPRTRFIGDPLRYAFTLVDRNADIALKFCSAFARSKAFCPCASFQSRRFLRIGRSHQRARLRP
ncbi:MAG: FAD/NAD(P)-binding protein [Methylocystis sp.]|uniref:FAD/NAD(P)-binding protein n=1 Tax=Methylocystis sp. TaxID=1911079 RepID=UPI003DA63ABF